MEVVVDEPSTRLTALQVVSEISALVLEVSSSGSLAVEVFVVSHGRSWSVRVGRGACAAQGVLLRAFVHTILNEIGGRSEDIVLVVFVYGPGAETQAAELVVEARGEVALPEGGGAGRR